MSSVALIEELNPEHEPTALAETAPGAIQLMLDLEASGALTTRALNLPVEIEDDRVRSLGVFLGELKSRNNFYLGDWLLYVEQHHPDEFSQWAELTGLSEQTNQRVMSVCQRVPASRRNACSWSIHAAVAALPAREQKVWLGRALKGGWGYSELRKQMAATRHDDRPELFPDDAAAVAEPDVDMLVESARALVHNAEVAGENVICRIEDYRRVVAALGEEE